MILGTDRSHHNSKVPLQSLFDKGVKFIWFKAAQWTSGEDKTFNPSWQEAKNTAGLLRGAYYFFDPRYDGVAQAKQFLSVNINFSAPGCIGGCVDVEDLVVFGSDGKVNHDLTDQANKWVANNWLLAIQRLNDFLAYFQSATGKSCMIYSYNGYMKEYLHGTKFPNNYMWISSLQDTCPLRYDTKILPDFWQWTYNWNGTDMDGNYFMGTETELNKLANY